ncbi:MAG: ECF-type sigma factor [Planctomycetota bacterium JB042]
MTSTSDRSDATRALNELASGDGSAAQRLLPLVYDRLRDLARRHLDRERPGHTLQATALVHEAYLKLVRQNDVDWKGKTHFFAIGAGAIRRILVDHARTRGRGKRGGGARKLGLDEGAVLSPERDEDVLALEEALERLERQDPRQARIVELRFFGGLNVAEVAEVLGVSKRTVEADWTMVRAWLRRELSETDGA